jgi:hypothetical protein
MSTKSNVVNMQGLKVVVFPGSGSGSAQVQPAYDEAYATWKLVWKQTLLELDGNSNLYSDHFTRQDYIVGLYHGIKCIALCCFRRADLTRATDREDSWFQPWPTEALNSFAKEYRDGVVLSWLTIHPDYRRSVSIDHLKEFSASDRLCELINLFLQDCKMDLAFGVTRNNRSVNKMSEYVGFRTYQNNAKHHGVDVDLITLVPDDLKVAQLKFPATAFELWGARSVIVTEPLQLHSQSKEQKRKLKLVG